MNLAWSDLDANDLGVLAPPILWVVHGNLATRQGNEEPVELSIVAWGFRSVE